MKSWVRASSALVTVAVVVFVVPSAAQTRCAVVTRADVPACAANASPDVVVAVAEGRAIAGRQRAAGAVFRQNPVLAATIARRNSDTSRDTNWSVNLSQEVEIAGQRGARVEAADAEHAAQGFRVAATERDAIAAGWLAYFDVLARAEEQALASRLAVNAAQIATAARGMADKGLLAPIDADVADAAQVAASLALIEAEEARKHAAITLGTLFGAPPQRIEGDLVPLGGLEAARQLHDVPEEKAGAAEARAHLAAASVYRRARIPSPTLSLFVQNDGFSERVLGAGLSMPIPVRFFNGEIGEETALASRAEAESKRAHRRAEGALGTALTTYDAALQKRALYTQERMTRAERDIETIAKELQAGRIAVRDALVQQQALVTMLRAAAEARHQLCLASVEVARAANILDRSAR